MAFSLIEGFTWCGSSLAVLCTRYGATPGTAVILASGGRFSGNALSFENGSFDTQLIPLPATIGPTVMASASIATNGGFTNSTEAPMMGFYDGATLQVYITISTAGLLRAYRGDGTLLGTGTRALANTSYYTIGMKVLIANAGGTFRVEVDGAADIVLTGLDTQVSAAAQATALFMGGIGAGVPIPRTRFCDLYVKDSGNLLGERRVITGAPNADGAELQWTPSTGLTQFNLVNTEPPDTTKWIDSNTVGNRSTFGLPSLGYDPVSFDALQLSFYGRKDSPGVRTIKLIVRVAGVDYDGTARTITSTYLDYPQIYETNPATASAWATSGGGVLPLEAGVLLNS